MKRPSWRRCPHVRIRGIYGDEIIFASPGFRRLQCLDCGRHLDGPVTLATHISMSDHLGWPVKIRRNGDGSIDEIVARNIAQIHVEQMDARHWRIGIYAHDGRSWMVNLTTPRATISCHIEADELGGSDV